MSEFEQCVECQLSLYEIREKKKKNTIKAKKRKDPLVNYSTVMDNGFSHRACTAFLCFQPSKELARSQTIKLKF